MEIRSSHHGGDRAALTRSAEFLLDVHHIKRVVLLAHTECGYYRKQYQMLPSDEVTKKQVEDLHTAKKWFKSRQHDLTVDTYYIVVQGTRIRFEPC